jgi:hypothetical protein
MTCFDNQDGIHRYLDGEMSSAERARFEEHLTGCQICQRELTQVRALFSVLEGLQEAPTPARFLEEVLAGLPAQPAPSVGRWILVAQAAAAVVLLALAYPQFAAWYEHLDAWFAPGWLSSQVAEVATWGNHVWTWLVEALTRDIQWAWPRGFGLTGFQAALMALALAGLWWLGNRLLLAARPNRTGGMT